MARRHMRNEQFYNQHCSPLQELQVGDSVQIQNQDGIYPRWWTKTGRVVEKHDNRQYQVRVDGSGRTTLHNRWFLRKILTSGEQPAPRHTRNLRPVYELRTSTTTEPRRTDGYRMRGQHYNTQCNGKQNWGPHGHGWRPDSKWAPNTVGNPGPTKENHAVSTTQTVVPKNGWKVTWVLGQVK